MRHRHPRAAALLLSLPGALPLGLSLALTLAAPSAQAAPPLTLQGRQLERLDRALIALPAAQADTAAAGMLLSWRVLGSDPADLRFNVYRDGQRLNAQPLAASNFRDPQGRPGAAYSLRLVQGGQELAQPAARTQAWAQGFLRIPVQKPADGVTPDGQTYRYHLNDGSAADLDGDGQYELIVKWQPDNAKDNSQKGYTGPTLIDAYRLDGTRLWRINLGPNIRAGAHYTSFLAYDFDGDGRAELMMKTADGSVDGRGQTIGQAGVDHRNAAGYVLEGPEFLSVFDGLSGAVLASAPYTPPRGEVSAWGDAYGNRVDRFLAGVAYLDGQRPSAVFSRGYYTRAVIAAWDWRDGQLSQRWVFDSNDTAQGSGPAAGQGAHWFAVADVDGDGRDDIVYGAATIASSGRLLYSTGLCHGDALHVGRLDPLRAGLQAYMVHESPACYGEHGLEMHDAASGKILWSQPGDRKDIGRGVCMDIDPAHPGEECWGSAGPLVSAQGRVISEAKPRRMNFGLWWDGDLLRELLDHTVVEKWQPGSGSAQRLLSGDSFGAAANNGTKGTPVLSADLLGDWREEVVWRSADDSALLLFSSPYETAQRLPTLMHDAQYRVQVAAQNAGYNQPPHPSFYLGAPVSQVLEPARFGQAQHLTLPLPEGNHEVCLTLGDPQRESDTTVRAELRRLVLQQLRVPAGQSQQHCFVVNVRSATIPARPGLAAGQVALKVPRETVEEAAAWDGQLSLEIGGAWPAVQRIDWHPVRVPTLFLLGDSTVADQGGEPYASWGQMLPRFLGSSLAVANHAESGETYRDSLQRRRLDKVLSALTPGDWVLLQFGHNDQKQLKNASGSLDSYRAEMRQHVEAVRRFGGQPVLITSMERRNFDEAGRIRLSLTDYAQATRELARELNVPLVDLHAMSVRLYEALGPEASRAGFAQPAPGKIDNTHHSNYGAYELAKAVLLGLHQAGLPIAPHLREDQRAAVLGFNPAQPDDPRQFRLPPSPERQDKPAGD